MIFIFTIGFQNNKKDGGDDAGSGFVYISNLYQQWNFQTDNYSFEIYFYDF